MRTSHVFCCSQPIDTLTSRLKIRRIPLNSQLWQCTEITRRFRTFSIMMRVLLWKIQMRAMLKKKGGGGVISERVLNITSYPCGSKTHQPPNICSRKPSNFRWKLSLTSDGQGFICLWITGLMIEFNLQSSLPSGRMGDQADITQLKDPTLKLNGWSSQWGHPTSWLSRNPPF